MMNCLKANCLDMRIVVLLLVVFVFAFSCSPDCGNKGQGQEETSIEDQTNRDAEYLTNAVVWFQKSAEMRAMYIQTFNFAKKSFDAKLKEFKSDKTPAVVVDVDETVLDNSPFEGFRIETGKDFNKEDWSKWVSMASARALPGALEFLSYAKSQGADVYYISNRNIEDVSSTVKNLEELGFPNASAEFMLFKDSVSGKEPRRLIVQETHEILILIGDNLSDFADCFEQRGDDLGFSTVDEHKGEFGDRFFILPNPMYGDWEKAVFDYRKNLSVSQMDSIRRASLEAVKL